MKGSMSQRGNSKPYTCGGCKARLWFEQIKGDCLKCGGPMCTACANHMGICKSCMGNILGYMEDLIELDKKRKEEEMDGEAKTKDEVINNVNKMRTDREREMAVLCNIKGLVYSASSLEELRNLLKEVGI